MNNAPTEKQIAYASKLLERLATIAETDAISALRSMRERYAKVMALPEQTRQVNAIGFVYDQNSDGTRFELATGYAYFFRRLLANLPNASKSLVSKIIDACGVYCVTPGHAYGALRSLYQKTAAASAKYSKQACLDAGGRLNEDGNMRFGRVRRLVDGLNEPEIEIK